MVALDKKEFNNFLVPGELDKFKNKWAHLNPSILLIGEQYHDVRLKTSIDQFNVVCGDHGYARIRVIIKDKTSEVNATKTFLATQPANQCSTINFEIRLLQTEEELEFLEELFAGLGYTLAMISFIIGYNQSMEDIYKKRGYIPVISAHNRRTQRNIIFMFKQL